MSADTTKETESEHDVLKNVKVRKRQIKTFFLVLIKTISLGRKIITIHLMDISVHIG